MGEPRETICNFLKFSESDYLMTNEGHMLYHFVPHRHIHDRDYTELPTLAYAHNWDTEGRRWVERWKPLVYPDGRSRKPEPVKKQPNPDNEHYKYTIMGPNPDGHYALERYRLSKQDQRERSYWQLSYQGWPLFLFVIRVGEYATGDEGETFGGNLWARVKKDNKGVPLGHNAIWGGP